MQLLSPSFCVLLAALGFLAQGIVADESCECYARKLSQPLDGWKYVYDTGSPRCVREPADLACTGEQYYNPVSLLMLPDDVYLRRFQDTRIADCCAESGNLVWKDKEAKLGYVSGLRLRLVTR